MGRSERRADTRYIAYGPWPSQRDFHQLKARYKGFSGPIRTGKSVAVAQEALKLCYLNQGCVGLIGAPTYRMLEDVLKKTFLGLLIDNAIPFTPRWAENKVTLTECGSEVLFRATDTVDRLRGTTLAWFGLDELTYSQKAAWEVLEGRLSSPKAQVLEGFGCWTPKGFDWVYHRFIGNKKLPGFEAIRARPAENKAVLANDPEYYDRLKHSYDERFYRQEILGEYLSIFAGQVYYAFDRMHNVKSCPYNPREPLRWSLDFNVNPMCSVVAQIENMSNFATAIAGNSRRELRVIHEFLLPDSNTPAACEAFGKWAMQHYTGRQVDVYIYGDASGSSRSTSGSSDWDIVRNWFRDKANHFRVYWKLQSGNPYVKDRINAVNGALCNYSGERKLFVDPSCEELTTDFEQVIWETDKTGRTTGEIDKTSDHKRTHLSDALGYLLEQEFRLAPGQGPRSTVI